MKIYIAAPLFSEADRDYNEKVAQMIEKENINVYLPQRNASINDKTKFADSIKIFHGDTFELDESDVLVAFLDGPVIDPGVAAEIGYIAGKNAYTNKVIPIIGLLTDSRDMSTTSFLEKNNKIDASGIGESQYCYQNLYCVGAIKEFGSIVNSITEMLKCLSSIQLSLNLTNMMND